MTEPKKVVFELPNERTPGYLRRLKALSDFQEAQKSEANGTRKFDNLCRFLAGYVVEPSDKDEAYEALMDATKEQIDELFALIGGGNKTDIPPSSGVS